jgi:hypothetical protein
LQLLLFAGLWENWRESKEAEPLYTYTIVTGRPHGLLGQPKRYATMSRTWIGANAAAT